MTRIITITLTALIFLSSCGNKFSLIKRKYTRGYYISSSKGHEPTKREATAKTATNRTRVVADQAAVAIEHVYPSPIKTENHPPSTNTSISNADNLTKTKEQADKRLLATAAKTQLVQLMKSVSSHIKPISLSKIENKKSKKDDTSDVKLILLVILCLFWWLDLLAVFIHDNKTITMNFWITLLLDLLFIVGIVFAILVVLDVVDVK